MNNSMDMSNYVEIVFNPCVDASPYGKASFTQRKGLIIKGKWQDSLIEFIKDNQVTALYLNSSKGWSTTDYSFLKNLSSIEELHIISRESNNLESIESMECLEEISITTSTKSVIDFTKLKRLRKCYLYWWVGAASIFHSDTLKSLYVDKINSVSCKDLSNLKALECLTIANSNVDDVTFLSSLNRLRKLQLLNCKKVSSLSVVSELSNLIWLNVGGFKNIGSLAFLCGANKLEVLLLSDCGNIVTLAPVSNLLYLKAFSFSGGTKVLDGDLSYLVGLPNLAMLMFAPRRHYTHDLIKKWDWNNVDKPDMLLRKK